MRGSPKDLREKLALPKPGDYRPAAVRMWFDNVACELGSGIHAGNDEARIKAYYVEAGLLRVWRRPFFWRHYTETISKALKFLFGGTTKPTILDLGCGFGTQSLLFALHGAKVVAVDMDRAALRIFRRRLELYQELCGCSLSVTIVEGNTFELDYAKHGPFDCVYSLFAFNMMQPSTKLLDTLLPNLTSEARWAVLDGNNLSVWNTFLPWRRRCVWSPRDMARELGDRFFSVVSQHGGVALPPPFWALLPYWVARLLDQWLCRSLVWPISCQTLAIRDRSYVEDIPISTLGLTDVSIDVVR